MKTTFDYDLIDDNGVSTIELPIKLYPGTIFEHEFGSYKVIEKPKYDPESYMDKFQEKPEETDTLRKPEIITELDPIGKPVSEMSQEEIEHWSKLLFGEK